MNRLSSLLPNEEHTLRSRDIVMDPSRLGALHGYRLSFMRILMRRLCNKKWAIKRSMFDLDSDGIGAAVYSIKLPQQRLSFVAFAHALDDDKRSDRVIAEQWDMTTVLCIGDVDAQRLAWLKTQVPLQEKGRLDADCLILSRANRSSRHFDYVIDCLASGHQPDLNKVAQVGYLYRTTAVYGSGKFGLADWRKLSANITELSRPFTAELLTCFLIRQFSLDQAQHIASARAPGTSVTLDPAMQRYFGIGNATGLGMAPFLIKHPRLIATWIEIRERALARALYSDSPDTEKLAHLISHIKRAALHFSEIDSSNEQQNLSNSNTRTELLELTCWLASESTRFSNWRSFTDACSQRVGIESQEIINSLLIENFPGSLDDLEDQLCDNEHHFLEPQMQLSELICIIENDYTWALSIDFGDTVSQQTFWYRSEEKMEPRIGNRYTEPGHEFELGVGIAWRVQECYRDLKSRLEQDRDNCTIAEFVLKHPEHRSIIRRVQSLTGTVYGDIQINTLDASVLPIHLLRCKLAFFGVAKFDPRSRLWVRNTMFQGAPVLDQLVEKQADDWFFPVKPALSGE